MAGKCKYCGFVGTNDEMADHAGEMCQGDHQPDTMEETRHNHQHTQPEKCPVCENGTRYVPYGTPEGIKCKWCNGTGIQQASA